MRLMDWYLGECLGATATHGQCFPFAFALLSLASNALSMQCSTAVMVAPTNILGDLSTGV